MKKSVFALLGVLLFAMPMHAQGDIPTTRPLKIGDNNKLDVKTSNQGTLLRMPSVLDESLTSKNEKPGVQMLPDRQLVQAGHDMVIDPKIKEKKEKGSNEYFGDQYLGDFTTKAKFVGIVARDHEYVDGDRIKIYVNGEVVEYNLLLDGSFKGLNLDLVEGFNRVEFEALNQGSSGPNTAQVVVTDDKGVVIHNNRWNLSTGSKASLIIVKEEDTGIEKNN
ncbi:MULTISPECIES: hypothetical protein [Flavobacteriaceae]|jgi:hypothetical protein|uniref:Secreted protein n=1 Tax=Flagellimonas sp. MMG031 TaxID=3158549 RepID=A0AAU7MYV8_9FLAO|nr:MULTISPECIES: hypothetical protein [unclassified Allomuricauda]MBO6532902.1 hypothetical protein [Allomuricauda sp.]MBO6587677.1 hypothetical protein [Allomuricauda sp.]MBO6617302.1 hypothetical protein [Allomuricauda sp.]MBO6643687.1 hypothetical protein [Allomuricauda sp.]MBO6745637.1 hypothetical protein [Allomuricauda sp.]